MGRRTRLHAEEIAPVGQAPPPAAAPKPDADGQPFLAPRAGAAGAARVLLARQPGGTAQPINEQSRLHLLRSVQSAVGNRSVQRLLNTAVVQRQPRPQTTPAPAPGPAAPAHQTPAEFDRVVQTQIEQLLDRFQHIPVTVRWQEGGQQRSEVVRVHPPYFINRENERQRLATATHNRGAARGALAELLSQIDEPAPEVPPAPQPAEEAGHRSRRHPRRRRRAIQAGNVRGRHRALIGKATPEDIQTILQEAVDHGLVQATHGGTHPDAQDLRAWLVEHGIGVDCSGFVSQALNLAASAAPGGEGAVPLDLVDTGTGALTGSSRRRARFTRVAQPSDLRPGDTMSISGHHVRIVMRVARTAEGIQITTAESSSAEDEIGRPDVGPTENVWLFRDPSSFTPLERRVNQAAALGSGPTVGWEANTEPWVWGRYRVLAGLRPAEPAPQQTP